MTIRLPPIQPERDIVDSFSALTDHLRKVEEKYNQLMNGQQASTSRSSLLVKLETLREKTYMLIGLLQSLELGLLIISYPVQVPERVTSHMRNRLRPLIQHIQTLDRGAYRGFFKNVLRKVKDLQQQTITLNNNIQHSIDSLRPVQSPRMLIQRTTTVPIHSNQLFPPPPLRRSFNM